MNDRLIELEKIGQEAMDKATEVLGCDPAYYGDEGTEEVDRQLKKMGYSLEWLRAEFIKEENKLVKDDWRFIEDDGTFNEHAYEYFEEDNECE